MSKFNNDTGDAVLDLALAELNGMGYGSNWSISRRHKSLRQFGRRVNMANGSIETIWQSPPSDETYLSPADGNLIDTYSSSSTLDVGDTIIVEGDYWSGTDLISHTQEVVSNGQNKVLLSRPLCRLNHAYHRDNTPGVGVQHFYEDTAIASGVPTDTSKIHLTIRGDFGESQTYKTAYSTAFDEAIIITAFTVGAERNAAGAIDFLIEQRDASRMDVFLSTYGGLPVITTGNQLDRLTLRPAIIVPPNFDVRMRGTAGSASMSGDAVFSGYLAIRSNPL